MAVNSEESLVAVAYKGYPQLAWEINGPTQLAHCWRKREELAHGEVIEAIWHPHEAEVIGLFLEGAVFRQSPYEGEVDEIWTGASSWPSAKTEICSLLVTTRKGQRRHTSTFWPVIPTSVIRHYPRPCPQSALAPLSRHPGLLRQCFGANSSSEIQGADREG